MALLSLRACSYFLRFLRSFFFIAAVFHSSNPSKFSKLYCLNQLMSGKQRDINMGSYVIPFLMCSK